MNKKSRQQTWQRILQRQLRNKDRPVICRTDGLVNEYFWKHRFEFRDKSDHSLLFVFVDGLGIGSADPEKNPVIRYGRELFGDLSVEHFPGLSKKTVFEGFVYKTDPLLHVPGLPQSATGQTALFCGIDGASLLQRHIPGMPTFTLKKILRHESLFARMKKQRRLATLANGYSDGFFAGMRPLYSASTLVYQAAMLPFRSFRDIRADEALFMDITGRLGRKWGFHLPLFSIQKSAQILIKLAKKFDFVLFEYFLTDKAGHLQRPVLAKRSIELIEAFLLELVRQSRGRNIDLVISSDHGNVEDMTTKQHSRHFVPTFLWTDEHGHYPDGGSSPFDLVEVHRWICKRLQIPCPPRIPDLNAEPYVSKSDMIN